MSDSECSDILPNSMMQSDFAVSFFDDIEDQESSLSLVNSTIPEISLNQNQIENSKVSIKTHRKQSDTKANDTSISPIKDPKLEQKHKENSGKVKKLHI